MKRWYSLAFILALLISACTPIQPPAEVAPAPAQAEATDVLPPDPAVRTGTLDNGLTYYIRHNTEPMNRAELWLAVNAGSVLEDDDQKGLAHFLEHMLFNGTENFPGSGVVDFLESVGMEFGPDVNAHTSFDETVYTIQVPTDDPAVLETGVQVLADWAGRATLESDEIDQERDVIVEEWRLRQQTAQGRISEKLIPFILDDSRYSERLPIGDMDIVRTAPREAFLRFYHDWYRPDLMAVIAVGDFDVDEVEKMIRAQFSDLPSPEQPKTRTVYDVPPHEGTRYMVVADPEQTTTRLVSFTLRPAHPIQTSDDLRADMIADLFYIMLNKRLDEIARQPDAPFLSAGSGTSDLVRPVQAAVISAQVQEEKALDAMEAVITEIERVRRFGFTKTELARAEQELFKFYEQLYNERENTESRTFADDYLKNYLEGESIPSIELLYQTVQELMPTITLEEVNETASLLAANDNRVVYLVGPEKEDTPLPSEDDLAAVVASVESLAIEPYVDTVAGSDLLSEMPAPAPIVEENQIDDLGVTELRLANGVRVLLKPTDFKDDEIVFNAVSPGGSSLVSDEDYPEASTIDDVINESGVDGFTQTELVKLLAGKSLTVTPYIRELSEGMDGKTTPEDLETLFQLIYLYFTAPRADENAFEVFRTKKRTELINREQDPNAALSDALNEALYGGTIRRGPLPVEEVDALDFERGFEIYKDRFGDAGDFNFTFVGSFDLDEIKSLAQTYLGSLPAGGRVESWQDVAPDLPEGVVKTDVYKGEGDRSVVQIVFTGPAEPTRQTELELKAVGGVLDIMLREKLREELGGAYSVGSYAFIQDAPDPTYFLIVVFGTDPDRVQEMIDATFAQVEELRTNGPSPENVEKVIAQQLSGHQEEMETNKFWLTTLKDFVFYQTDDKLTVLEPEYEDKIKALDAETIQAAAQKFLNPDRYVQAALFPESYASDSE